MTNRDKDTRSKILAAALDLFSRQQTSDFTLKELAKRIELHYTVLYHYFKNRSDLEAVLIEDYCVARGNRLEGVVNRHERGLESLADFIRVELAQPPTNLLVQQLDRLEEPYRSRVHQASRANTQQLATLIEQGIEDGSIRHCDAQLVASILLRMLNRYANQNEDVLAQAGLAPAALADQLIDLVRHGLLSPTLDRDKVPSRFKAPFPKLATSDSNLDAILRAFIGWLNQRGYDGTSIPDVAASIGMSKTSFYRFASSKEELLYLAAHHSLSMNMQVRAVSRALCNNPLDTLLHTSYYLRYLLNNAPGPSLRPAIFFHLNEVHGRTVWDIHRATRFDLMQLLQEGIDEGLFRPMDAKVVQPMLTNFMNTPLQTESDGFKDDIHDFMLHGISGTD